MNDEPPALKSGLNPMLYCLEGGEVVISTENLHATDIDSNDEKLLFIIARQPLHGVVQKRNQIADHFTQAEVIAGVVKYIHTGKQLLLGATIVLAKQHICANSPELKHSWACPT